MYKEIIVMVFCLIFLGIVALIVYFSNKHFEKRKQQEEREREEIRKWELKKEKEFRKIKSDQWNEKVQLKVNKTLFSTHYKPNKELKIILGDYDCWGASFTNSVLQSMGIKTFVVPTAYDIIDRIEAGEKYDIIITNHIYREGSGEEVLQTLKSKDDFNIPIIILTIDQDKRRYYVDNLGFDEYIPKALDTKKVKETFPKVIKDLKFTRVKEKKQ